MASQRMLCCVVTDTDIRTRMEKRVPLTKGVSELSKWIKHHNLRQPREVKSTVEADKTERRMARTLRTCRALDKEGKLPEEAASMLDEVRVKSATTILVWYSRIFW